MAIIHTDSSETLSLTYTISSEDILIYSALNSKKGLKLVIAST